MRNIEREPGGPAKASPATSYTVQRNFAPGQTLSRTSPALRQDYCYTGVVLPSTRPRRAPHLESIPKLSTLQRPTARKVTHALHSQTTWLNVHKSQHSSGSKEQHFAGHVSATHARGGRRVAGVVWPPFHNGLITEHFRGTTA